MASSIQAQIAEVEREIRLRQSVYPRQVQRGNMKQAEADIHLSRMEDVLETLKARLVDDNNKNDDIQV